jgi:ribosomal protein L34E
MPPHDRLADNATCPRCGAVFHCGARDEVPCECRTVPLDAATLQRLRERYTGCLCLRCLRALSASAASAPPAASSADPSQ